MRNYISFLFVLFCFHSRSQFVCENAFVTDTMSIPETSDILEGSYLEVSLKDFSMIRLFKTNENKYFLRMMVKKNFYFNKIGELEINSGSKSIHFKDLKQYKIDKTTGMFIQEVPRNYVFTLKDEGITSIFFANAETEFTKQDAKQIKKMAKCFYEEITTNKTNNKTL